MKAYYILIAIILLYSCSDKVEDLKDPNLKVETLAPGDVQLTVTGDNIPADGKTFSEIKMKVNRAAETDSKEVTFDISPVGKFSNGATSIKLTLDANGEARVFASSSTDGVAYVKATVGEVSQTVVVKFLKPATPVVDTLKLSVVRELVPADNYAYVEIQAVVEDPEVLKEMKTIKFITDKGTFPNDTKEYTITLGLDGVAKAYIKHNRAEMVRVTATVGNSYSKELNIRFIPSLPEQIFIEPSVASMVADPAAKSVIKARLVRSQGSVSEGQTVYFYDSTVNGSVGIFLNTTRSGTNGEATTEYWLQDTSYRGYVYIKGYVNTDTGRVLGMSRILIAK